MNSLVTKQFSAGFLTLTITALTAFQLLSAEGLTETELWQLGGIVVAAIGTIFLPLLKSGPAGALKVGVAVLGALFAALVTVLPLEGGWSQSSAIVVGLAVLNALATAVGVAVRLNAVTEAVADPTVSNTQIEAVDPDAFAIVTTRDPELVGASVSSAQGL